MVFISSGLLFQISGHVLMVTKMVAVPACLDLLPQEQLDKRILAAFIQSLDEISPGSVVELSGEKG
jgi:hypothetical protein